MDVIWPWHVHDISKVHGEKLEDPEAGVPEEILREKDSRINERGSERGITWNVLWWFWKNAWISGQRNVMIRSLDLELVWRVWQTGVLLDVITFPCVNNVRCIFQPNWNTFFQQFFFISPQLSSNECTEKICRLSRQSVLLHWTEIGCNYISFDRWFHL